MAATHKNESTVQADAPDTHASPLSPVAKRFYKEFMTRILASQQAYTQSRSNSINKKWKQSGVRGHARAAEEEDAAQRRLTRAQSNTLGPLLWQWLLLLHATTLHHSNNSYDDMESQQAGESSVAAAAQQQQEHVGTNGSSTDNHSKHDPRGDAHGLRLRTPWQVERLFNAGFACLLPTIAAAAAGVRAPTADTVAPWHNLQRRPSSGTSISGSLASPHGLLIRALAQLSQHGPLFSSWCALAFLCLSAFPNTPGDEDVEGVDPAARAGDKVRQLQEVWDAAARRLLHSALKDKNDADPSHVPAGIPQAQKLHSPHRDDSANLFLSSREVEQLWYEVHRRSASVLSSEATNRVDDAESATYSSSVHPLFPLWTLQWYVECCRVASHGRDDGFAVHAVLLTILTRVTHHLCRRLTEVVLEYSKEHKDDVSTGLCGAAVAAQATPLVVATLTGLAVQTPAVATAGPRRSVPQPRKRRRGWPRDDEDDDDDDDDEEEEKEAEESAEDPGSTLSFPHGGVRTGGPHSSAFARFLSSNEQLYEVVIAAGVLTRYCLTPTFPFRAGSNMAGDNAPFTAQVLPEVYLRNGEVHWWTVGDSQRHRQLMADKRS